MATLLGAIPAGQTPQPSGVKLLGNIDQSSATLAHSQQAIDQLRAKQAQAEQASQVANAPATIAKQTATGAIGSLANGALNFVRSAVHAPVDIVNSLRGKPVDQSTAPGFDGQPMKTIQGQAAEMAGNQFDQGQTGQQGPSPVADTANLVGQTVGGAADVLGAKGATEGLGPVLKKPINAVSDFMANRAAKKADEQLTKTAVEALTPKMSAKEIADAVASGKGTVKGGKASVDMTKDKNFMSMVGNTRDLVKGKSAIEDANAVRGALKTEAENLSEQVKAVQQPVSSKGTRTWLDAVKKPIEIEADSTQSRKFDLTKETLMRIVDKNLAENSNVGSLLKSRKEFDALVEKEFPNLYDHENAPFRNAVKGMRDALNNDIEANLPDGFGYKESLAKQRQYYDAIDNLASKAPQEIKDTSTFGKRHPIIKKGLQAAGTGAAGAIGAGGVYEGGKAVLGE